MKVVMVEDEYMVAKRLKRFISLGLQDHGAKLTHFETLDDAKEFMSQSPIDLLFLDLNLNGQDGFEILQDQLSKSFHTIVVSANTDRAIEAFEYGVLDFVAKPFTQERINKAISRLSNQTPQANCKYLSYKKLGKMQLMPVEEIACLKAAGHYTDVVNDTGEVVVHDKSLDKLMVLLGDDFVRVHRSYAVKETAIHSLCSEEGSKYWLMLHNGSQIPVGRTRVKSLKSRFY